MLHEGKRPLSPILKLLAEKWEVCGRGSYYILCEITNLDASGTNRLNIPDSVIEDKASNVWLLASFWTGDVEPLHHVALQKVLSRLRPID